MNKITIALISSLVISLPTYAQDAKPPYSFQTVESNPIPRDEYFVLLRKVTVKLCNNSPYIYDMFPDECFKMVKERRDACDKKIYKITPAIIYDKSTHMRIWERYLDCTMPRIGTGVLCLIERPCSGCPY